MESSVFTDEWFFATTIFNENHPFSEKVINDNKRYISPFNGGPHPKPITKEDIPKLSTSLIESEFYFIRKIDVLKEIEVIQWMDKIRNQDAAPLYAVKNGQIVGGAHV